MMLRIGYIGLGLMGKSMARNILKAGFSLVVHNRSRRAVKNWSQRERGRRFHRSKWQRNQTSFLPICRIHRM